MALFARALRVRTAAHRRIHVVPWGHMTPIVRWHASQSPCYACRAAALLSRAPVLVPTSALCAVSLNLTAGSPARAIYTFSTRTPSHEPANSGIKPTRLMSALPARVRKCPLDVRHVSAACPPPVLPPRPSASSVSSAVDLRPSEVQSALVARSAGRRTLAQPLHRVCASAWSVQQCRAGAKGNRLARST
jgi:hypothetical protein